MENRDTLRLEGLRASFHTRNGIVRAVNNVTFTVPAGKTVALVGESGSGKSVCQLSYMRLLPEPPLKLEGGKVIFQSPALGSRNLLTLSPAELRQVRGAEIAMIFQEPMTSLNPYLRVGVQVSEPLLVHNRCDKAEAWERAKQALKRVGIQDTDRAMNAFPHEYSGGMRQRVMIAMALTTRPQLLIADEPTTALDVTVQAQILDLLRELQQETGMSILFITHDLGVVAQIADEVVVMYAGRVLEQGPVDAVFGNNRHPYTEALLKSTPRLDQPQEFLPTIKGSPPDLTKDLAGCPFAGRCESTMDICYKVFPEASHPGPSRVSYCHLYSGKGGGK